MQNGEDEAINEASNLLDFDLGDVDLSDLELPATHSRSTSFMSIGFDTLEDLALPGGCSRSLSGHSVTSEGLAAIMFDDADDLCADSDGVDETCRSIDKTYDWMTHDTAIEKDCVKDIEAPTCVVMKAPSSTPAPASLPVPCSRDWSAYVYKPPSAQSMGTCVIIPRPTREILMEGMECMTSSFSFSPGEVKKQKIARYLEKRKRRLSKKRNRDVSSGTRREIANKRARQNGRFVSVSEFGAAPRRVR